MLDVLQKSSIYLVVHEVPQLRAVPLVQQDQADLLPNTFYTFIFSVKNAEHIIKQPVLDYSVIRNTIPLLIDSSNERMFYQVFVCYLLTYYYTSVTDRRTDRHTHIGRHDS